VLVGVLKSIFSKMETFVSRWTFLRGLVAVGVYLLFMLLMFIPPYTILADSNPLVLYAYWTAIALSALVATLFLLEERERR